MNGSRQVTLRKHWEGFTEEEFYFIINYDNKYPMGKDLNLCNFD